MSVEQRIASTTAELVSGVLDIARQVGDDRPLWHRGHSCGDHRLIASLPRKVGDVDKMLPMEQRLITRFRQRGLPFWPAGYPQNDWEQLFAMQHHGVPTRLLDWSENLFMALYFAASDVGHKHEVPEGEEPEECLPTLWVLDPVGWNRQASQLKEFPDVSILTTDSEDLKPYAPLSKDTDLSRRYQQPLAIFGTYNSARIIAQRGSFTVTGYTLEPMEQIAESHQEPALWSFRLKMDRAELQRDLVSLGFAESMLFPDLVGVSKEIAALEGLR